MIDNLKPIRSLVAALALGACAFSSEEALFSEADGAQIFANGSRYHWTESGGERYDITFRQTGAAYEVTDSLNSDQPLEGVLFVPIADTPEDDYIVQVRLDREDQVQAYGFMWRVGESYRVVTDPGRIVGIGEKLRGAERYCTWRTYQECGVVSAAVVLALYREGIYPRFVAGGEAPDTYMELTPFGLPLPENPRK